MTGLEGDSPLAAGAGEVFGSLPAATRLTGPDDLADTLAGLARPPGVEDMVLHLADYAQTRLLRCRARPGSVRCCGSTGRWAAGRSATARSTRRTPPGRAAGSCGCR